MLVQMFWSKNLFPSLFIKTLFVVEFMYSIYFVFSTDRRWSEYFRFREKSIKRILRHQILVFIGAFLSVQFGLIIPFLVGDRIKGILSIAFDEIITIDSIFIGHVIMFCIYSLTKIFLEIIRKFQRIHDLMESLCFFKIALLIFFIFYATFGFLVDIISYPLSNGSFTSRFSGTSGTNPMSIGILYFLIGSEIVHFMSNPLVISHFRKGVSFFRPISRNGHITTASLYSVPCLLFFIWIFSIVIKRLFPSYGPIRFISQGRKTIFDSVDEICLMIFIRKVRIASYKPFSTTLFTRLTSWAVKRVAGLFCLSSYLYGGRFEREERKTPGILTWVPKRNEFYRPEQLQQCRRFPVRLVDLKIKKMLLLHEHFQMIHASPERSPPEIHASFDICFVPSRFYLRLCSFCLLCMGIVIGLFSCFLVVSVCIGWRLIEMLNFEYKSDFFAYFFGRAVLKVLMLPIYALLNWRKSFRVPTGKQQLLLEILVFALLIPFIVSNFFSSLNPFLIGCSEKKGVECTALQYFVKNYLSTTIFISCFLSGRTYKSLLNIILYRSYTSPLQSFRFPLRISSALLLKFVCNSSTTSFSPEITGTQIYGLLFKLLLITWQSWNSFRNDTREKSKERLENLQLKNYEEFQFTNNSTPLLNDEEEEKQDGTKEKLS